MAGSTCSSALRGGSSPRLGRRSSTLTPTPDTNAGSRETVDPLLLRHYQHLTRKHLRHLLKKLVADYTGLMFHVAWAPPGTVNWDPRRLPTGHSLACRLAQTGRLHQPDCRLCGPKHLARALQADGDGLFFKCPLDVRNYWLPIRVRRLTVGIAYLQALDSESRLPRARTRARRATPEVSNHTDFRRAARLLQLVVEHLETLDVADLRKTELRNAGYALLGLEREQVRLREAVKRHLPPPALVSHRPGLASHGEEAVRMLLDWIGRSYSQPITLRECAARLGMNASYLSALFSQAVGVPFKSYLTDIRIRRAKALLGDLSRTVSEVSYAVGYSNEHRFRVMFKKATGLGPKLWRQTLREGTAAPKNRH